uniref:Uncharacterized protein n=1 Tax=Opuntia streptacantha TaxID=393608 RepID=A0A7C9A5R2_OPUST
MGVRGRLLINFSHLLLHSPQFTPVMRCLWSPTTNPTQVNNPAKRTVCKIGTSARGAEMELRHNDDAGTSSPGALRFRRQRRGEGGFERFVRARRAEGSRKWPKSRSSRGNFMNFWRPKLKLVSN